MEGPAAPTSVRPADVDVAGVRISNAITAMRAWLNHCSVYPPSKGWGTSLRPVLDDCRLIHHASQLGDPMYSSAIFQRGHGFRLRRMAACGSAYDAILDLLGDRAAHFDLFLVSLNGHHADAKRLLADLLVWGFPQELEAALQRLWGGGGTTMVTIRYCGLEEDGRLIEEELRFDLRDRMLSELAENTSQEEFTDTLREDARWEEVSADNWIRDISMARQNPPELCQALSLESSGQIPDLEASFVRDPTCCGLKLPSPHELMQHYQKVHPMYTGFEERERDFQHPRMLDGEASSGLIPARDPQQQSQLRDQQEIRLQKQSNRHDFWSAHDPNDSWGAFNQRKPAEVNAGLGMTRAARDDEALPQPNIRTYKYDLSLVSAASETSDSVRPGTDQYQPRISEQRTYVSAMVPSNWPHMSSDGSFQDPEEGTSNRALDMNTARIDSQASRSSNIAKEEEVAIMHPTNRTRHQSAIAVLPQQLPRDTSPDLPSTNSDIEMFGLSFNVPPLATSGTLMVQQMTEVNVLVGVNSPDADSPWPETPPPPYALSPGGFVPYG